MMRQAATARAFLERLHSPPAMMRQATTARAFLERLHPWIGRAVHTRWTTSRMTYRSELESILLALAAERGHVPPKLGLRVQGLLAKLHREWFPPTWRRNPTWPRRESGGCGFLNTPRRSATSLRAGC